MRDGYTHPAVLQGPPGADPEGVTGGFGAGVMPARLGLDPGQSPSGAVPPVDRFGVLEGQIPSLHREKHPLRYRSYAQTGRMEPDMPAQGPVETECDSSEAPCGIFVRQPDCGTLDRLRRKAGLQTSG